MKRRSGTWQQIILYLGCGAVMLAAATSQGFCQVQAKGAGPSQTPGSLDWDATFADHSNNRPLHFIADYTDTRGPHRLEEWRTGVTHLRRRTDDRIDLHADATNGANAKAAGSQAMEYQWQILDLQKHIANRISSQTMLQAGLFYSYYSMAHVIARPAGRFGLSSLPGEPGKSLMGHTCNWYEVSPEGQAKSRICWSSELAIPLEIRAYSAAGTQTSTFQVRSVDEKAIASAVFKVNLAGLTVHDHDQMTDVD